MRGKFSMKKDWVYKMPAHFLGAPFYPYRAIYPDMLAIEVSYETDAERLLQYLPDVFELRTPVVSIQYSNCRDVEWMSGGDYRLIQVTIPTTFKGEGDTQNLDGDYALVVWENNTWPILGGREEDGVPKIFADIARERHVGEHWFTAASYESRTFLTIDFERKAQASQDTLEKLKEQSKINPFGWRYLANLGKGGAALSQATLYPQEVLIRQLWTGEGSVQWTKLLPHWHPGQYSIIQAFAELPIIRYNEAKMMVCSASLNVGDSRVLTE